MHRVLAITLAIMGPAPALAQNAPNTDDKIDQICKLSPGEPGMVAEVIDGDTLALSDGRVVRMAGIEAPKPHLARASANVDALFERARHELDRLAGGARIELQLGEHRGDRHGRTVAQLHLGDGTWLQEAMVAGGFARVRPWGSGLSCLNLLLARERDARDARRGIWRNAEFAIIRANDPSLIERKGLYVLVEGRVVSVGRGNHMDFLNFGHSWRHDFTVLIDRSVAGRLAEGGGVPVESLAGRRVLVRGVIQESGGPAIRLSEPGEIKILDDD